MAKKVVIASACRTAIGKMGGALSNTPAADLGAIVIKEALNQVLLLRWLTRLRWVVLSRQLRDRT